jgi:hypothetical protein
MLDVGFHQAAGLQGLTPQSQLRVIAVASAASGATAGPALDALWQVCSILQRLGSPVVVLDGTAQETESSPGLLHLLQQAPWHEAVTRNAGAAASSLAVIPAANGLLLAARRARAHDGPPLDGLQPYFRTYGLMVLHAPAATLGPLLTHTATIPLVMMAQDDASGVLDSYKSLKQIALDTGLPCMVAGLLGDDTAAGRRRVRSALRTLQECAEQHLCGPVRTTAIATRNPQDLQRLALQLLENAGTMTEASPLPQASRFALGMPAQFARSH